MPRDTLLPLPGWDGPGLSVSRDAAGRLLRMAVGDRLHLERQDGDVVLGGGLARMRELATPGRLLRAVHSQGRSWQESYHCDEAGRPTLVDGVTIAHDALGRVVLCDGPAGAWRYGYDARGHLGAIEPPGEQRRRLRWDAAGRPIDVVAPGVLDPGRHGRDALGRLWTLRDAAGTIRHTYLWDGLCCLGRIDGPPDAPLACVFSLDLTFTPVRLIGWDGVRIVPRDAFGEALLGIPGTPGLFGGTVAGDLVHLRARALDPRRGTFTAPDPFDGSEQDPRRAHGWRGALPVEPDGAHQPFAVCRNDPIGRADPTGEISAGVATGLLTLSSLTWSSGNMLVSFFLMDPLNFILGFFTKPFWTEGRWFSKSAMRARYHGGYGFRYDPLGFEALGINEGRAWTVQHVIWAQRKEFDELNPARVFTPVTPFRPKLYGSLLRIEAAAAGNDLPLRVLLLHGAQRADARLVHGAPVGSPEIAPLREDHAWTRRGGAAEAVVPGARVPVFPSGGLHFPPQPRIATPRGAARIEEVLPTGEIAPGTVTLRKQLVVKKLGIGLAAGQEVMLTGAASARALVTLDAVRIVGKETLLFLRADPPGALGTSDLHLRGIQTPTAAAPARAAVALPPGSAPGRLDARPTTADPIAASTPLRLKQAGVVVGGAVVDRLEAAVGIDVAPERAKGDKPRRIWLAAPNAAGPDRPVTATTARSLTFPAGTAPAKGAAIVVFIPGAGGASAARLVADDPVADQRALDRDLPAALSGAAAGALRWRPLAPVRALGVWDDATGAAAFVYRPEASGTAVAAGPLLVRDDDNTIRQVRDGTGLLRDELVLGTAALPGNPAVAYDVEPLAFDGPERGDARLETITIFAFASPPGAGITTAPRPALALHRLNGATVAAALTTPLLTALPALAGATITLALPADAAKLVAGSAEATTAPTPGQLVRLTAGAVDEAVLVKTVRVEALANHDPGLGAAALSLVPLMPAGFLYAAEFLAPDRVRLRPDAHRLAGLEPLALAAAAPPTVAVQMPQLAVGELVRAVWNGVANTALLQVEAAEGTVLKLAGGDLAALVAAAPADLKLMRMAPVDPGTGTPFAGINGAVVAPAPARLRFDVWAPNALAARAAWYTAAGDATAAAALTGAPALHRWWAVTDGTKTVPIQITATASLAVELHALPASLSGAAASAMAALHLSDIGLLGEYVLDGSQLTTEELDLAPGPSLVLALPHKPQAAGGVAAAGKLGSGTVMIPDDETESWYLDRPTALETHELRHTLQCAMMGPLLLGMLPIALVEDIVRSTTTLGDVAFSPYVAAQIVTDDGLRRLAIANPGGVSFEAGRKVEISAGNQVVLGTLGEADPAGFLLTGSAVSQIADGAVQVRQGKEELGDGLTALGWIIDICSLLTLGNLASTVGAAVFKLIPDLIGGAVNVANGKDFFDPYSLDRFPATVPDAARPASVRPQPRDGDTLTLRPHDRVRVSAGERSLDTVVTQVDGTGLADLATAPPVEGAERRLEIAVIGREDELRRVSTGVSDALHVPWLRWIYDPYGELRFGTDAKPDSAEEWVLKLARWALSSSAWSMVIPGIFIWDNALKQRNNKGHLSRMEQGASSASGDLYSPVARLAGKLEVVGDVARYRVWALSRTDSMIPQRLGDAPGAGSDPDQGEPWIFPRRRGGAAVVPPNADQQAHADAAVDVPDVLVQRNFLEPLLLTAGTPDRVLPADLARLPAEAGLQRTTGVHVGFSRPGAHRVTVGNLPFAASAGEAQTEGRQTILFDETVGDVTLRAAGRSLAEGDTLKLVPCQRVTFSVAPAAGRRHALLVQRPIDGTLARRPADLLLQVQTSLGTEVLEVQRVHAVIPFSIEEDKSARWPQAHLLPELRLAVRRLTIEVVDVIAVHASLVPAGAGPLPPVKPFALPGEEAFLVVPARLHLARPVLAVTYPAGARPANGTNPDPEVRPVTPVPSALAEVVADGAVLRLVFDATDPPEEPCLCEWTLSLRAQQPKIGGGTENISANIKASIEYRPHFRLELPAGVDTVAAGASIVLHTSNAVRAGAVTVTPSDGVTSAVSADGRDITLTVAAAAAKVARKVVVEDAAAPAHQAKRTILVT
ncbi:YD repeat-containing protein [Humitalea rosea]|uniref:YD repeat-containing protein n=1 Tax=Humitalea rosea TaxID=990373 RepID=A0A2W7K683_9PROT|nr:hypothetical protein [Humitalea rosea]PZW43010.1 YD repeat-containing protein [Humitalea rosea]